MWINLVNQWSVCVFLSTLNLNPLFALLPCRGVNVVPFLELIGLPESLVGLLKDSSSGYALTAYAMYKVILSGIFWVFLVVNISP